ncbi:unnamed protein product, partial [marine sediment metagenome]
WGPTGVDFVTDVTKKDLVKRRQGETEHLIVPVE